MSTKKLDPLLHILVPVENDEDAIRALRWIGMITPSTHLKKCVIELIGGEAPISKSVRDAARFPFVPVREWTNADAYHPPEGQRAWDLGERIPFAGTDWIHDPEVDYSTPKTLPALIRQYFHIREATGPKDGKLFYLLSEINPGLSKRFKTDIPIKTLEEVSNVRGRVYIFRRTGDEIEATRTK